MHQYSIVAAWQRGALFTLILYPKRLYSYSYTANRWTMYAYSVLLTMLAGSARAASRCVMIRCAGPRPTKTWMEISCNAGTIAYEGARMLIAEPGGRGPAEAVGEGLPRVSSC